MGTLHFDGNYYMKEPLLEDYIGRLRRHQLHDHAYGMQNDDYLINGDEDLSLIHIWYPVKNCWSMHSTSILIRKHCRHSR